jgi:hypothetical protein
MLSSILLISLCFSRLAYSLPVPSQDLTPSSASLSELESVIVRRGCGGPGEPACRRDPSSLISIPVTLVSEPEFELFEKRGCGGPGEPACKRGCSGPGEPACKRAPGCGGPDEPACRRHSETEFVSNPESLEKRGCGGPGEPACKRGCGGPGEPAC